MTRDPRPVFKYNLKGELIDTYPTVKEAAKSLRMEATKCKSIINGSGFIAGYIYSWSDQGITPMADRFPDFTKRAPWERNGYFDIRGWQKCCS